jgi:hypothetical protein
MKNFNIKIPPQIIMPYLSVLHSPSFFFCGYFPHVDAKTKPAGLGLCKDQKKNAQL